ncbi:hypothetical protein DRN58_02965 [Thermococci archaeon]|nr:MAG: hypothetical protein DRN58_02965 [Thermococci archaeon]
MRIKIIELAKKKIEKYTTIIKAAGKTMGTTIEDIERMQKLVKIFKSPKKIKEKKEAQIWEDVGVFKDIFPKKKNSVEIFQELSR